MKNLIKLIPFASLALPLLALAQGLTKTQQLIRSVGGIMNYLTTVVAAIALLVFIWGLVKFIFKIGGDEKAIEQGRSLMIWGSLALFFMVSIWGIVYFIGDELFPGIDYDAPRVPTFIIP